MSMTPYETACARYGQIAIDRMLTEMTGQQPETGFPKLEVFAPFLAEYGFTPAGIRGVSRKKDITQLRKCLMNHYWHAYYLTKRASVSEMAIEFDHHRTSFNDAIDTHNNLLFTKDVEYTRLVQNFDKFVSMISL